MARAGVRIYWCLRRVATLRPENSSKTHPNEYFDDFFGQAFQRFFTLICEVGVDNDLLS